MLVLLKAAFLVKKRSVFNTESLPDDAALPAYSDCLRRIPSEWRALWMAEKKVTTFM
jgi:hypothetical protein